MKLGPDGLFLLDRLRRLTPLVFREVVDRSEPFALKVDYRGLPPPIEELDLVRLIPATRSTLPSGTLVLRGTGDTFEFVRIGPSGHSPHDSDERVAKVIEVERPGVRIRLDSQRWRIVGFLLIRVPGFPRAWEWWRCFASYITKILHPFPCPISLGTPETLARGVIEKYAWPAEVQEQVKLSHGGLEEWEQSLLPRVLPLKGSVLVVGCGAGREAVGLAERGFRVAGIDPVASLIEAARRHAEAHGVEVTLEVKSVGELNGPPAAFDAILCSCYVHIPTRRRRIETLQQYQRLVTPQGVIILTAGWYPTRGPRLALVDNLRRLLRRLLGERFTTEPGDRLVRHLSLASDAGMPCFLHAYRSPEEIRSEIQAAGLSGEMDPDGPWIIRRPA